MTERVYRTAYESLLLPRIVRLSPNLYGACFTLMKLVPAAHILRSAYREGRLTDRSVVIETSSGTFGLALAMICNQHGWRFIMVSDPVADSALCRRLEDLGAEVEIVPEPAADGGYQRARLDRLDQLMAENPGAFCPSQYANPQNPAAYATVAEHLSSVLGDIDCLAGPVGSGGSLCGTSRALRVTSPGLTAIGIDTPGSVLFGLPDEHRVLRGLGNSLMPLNLDHSVFDEVHWLDAASAFRGTRALHQVHSLFMGPTSGVTFVVARWWARQNPDATVVAFFPDEGYRYQDSVYDDGWLKDQGLWRDDLPDEPARVTHPRDVGGPWSRMDWGRRRLADLADLADSR
jgi:cysteine synthase